MTVTEIVDQERRRLRHLPKTIDQNDLSQAALTQILSGETPPPTVAQWIRDTSRRAFNAAIKRARRHAIRSPSVEGLGLCPTAPSAEHQRVIDAEEIKAVTKSEFEREMVRVELGEHDRFAKFSEFARAEQFCSNAHAYRLRSAFGRRVAKRLDRRPIGRSN
jgi:hypothetical protein